MDKNIFLRSLSVLLLVGYLLGFAWLGSQRLTSFSHETEYVGVVLNLPSRFHEPMSFYELQHLITTVEELNSGPAMVQGLEAIPDLDAFLGDQPSNIETIVESLNNNQLRLAQSQLVELAVRMTEAHKKNQTILLLQFFVGLIGCFLASLLIAYAFRKPRLGGGIRVKGDSGSELVDPSSALAVAVHNISKLDSVRYGHDYVLELKGDDLLSVTDQRYPVMEAMICEMVSNAIRHGGRASPVRIAAGKPGTLKIFVGIEKNNTPASAQQWQITVADDGDGIDEVMVMKQALAKGLVSEESLRDLETGHGVKLILLEGYSEVKPSKSGPLKHNSLAAIRSTVQSMGGSISLRNRPGVFCEFVLKVPCV